MQALADGALAALPAVTGMYQQAGVAAGEHGEARVHGLLSRWLEGELSKHRLEMTP